MNITYFLLAFTVGAGITLQAGVNASLKTYVGHPAIAALISFIIGTIGLGIFVLFLRQPLPSWGILKSTPLWVWSGGLLGALFVASATFVAPKLGAATMFAIVISAQVATSLILDHFGWVGFPVHQINMWRIVGASLLIVGVLLVVRN